MGSGSSNSARSGRETENRHADLEQTETAKACLLKAGASSKAGEELSSLRSNGSLRAPPWPALGAADPHWTGPCAHCCPMHSSFAGPWRGHGPSHQSHVPVDAAAVLSRNTGGNGDDACSAPHHFAGAITRCALQGVVQGWMVGGGRWVTPPVVLSVQWS